jgi:hypothetical protein
VTAAAAAARSAPHRLRPLLPAGCRRAAEPGHRAGGRRHGQCALHIAGLIDQRNDSFIKGLSALVYNSGSREESCSGARRGGHSSSTEQLVDKLQKACSAGARVCYMGRQTTGPWCRLLAAGPGPQLQLQPASSGCMSSQQPARTLRLHFSDARLQHLVAICSLSLARGAACPPLQGYARIISAPAGIKYCRLISAPLRHLANDTAAPGADKSCIRYILAAMRLAA